MDFIDKHTAWSKQRLTSTRMERVAGFKITDEFGKQTGARLLIKYNRYHT